MATIAPESISASAAIATREATPDYLTNGFCVGCLRTGDEIARWMAMSAAEQWQLLAQLAERRKLAR